jgi:hypothetical protein
MINQNPKSLKLKAPSCQKAYCIYCTLKAGKGDGVSVLRGLLDVASLPLFFTAVAESRASDMF